jgi:hypothetical protein
MATLIIYFPPGKKLFTALIIKTYVTWYWCLMPIILATWEAETWRFTVPGQPEKKSLLEYIPTEKAVSASSLVIPATMGCVVHEVKHLPSKCEQEFKAQYLQNKSKTCTLSTNIQNLKIMHLRNGQLTMHKYHCAKRTPDILHCLFPYFRSFFWNLEFT